MGCGNTTRRQIVKRSFTSGARATVPPNEDHQSGLWSATDIYKGELFYNVVDGVIQSRDNLGITTVDINRDLSDEKTKSLTTAGTLNSQTTEFVPTGIAISDGQMINVDGQIAIYKETGAVGTFTKFQVSSMKNPGVAPVVFSEANQISKNPAGSSVTVTLDYEGSNLRIKVDWDDNNATDEYTFIIKGTVNIIDK